MNFMKHLPKIVIESRPLSEMPIEGQPGDWRYEDGVLFIRYTPMKNVMHEIDLALHELTEALECNLDGVTVEDVDKWDIEHPPNEGLGSGSSKDCPCHTQHIHAETIGHVFFSQRGEDWITYNTQMESAEWKELLE